MTDKSKNKSKVSPGLTLLSRALTEKVYKSFEDVEPGEYDVARFYMCNTKYGRKIGVALKGGKFYFVFCFLVI